MGLFVNDDNGMDMKGGVENLATILTTLGKQAHALDLKLLYHNHDFEFVKDSNGFTIIDYLLENCDPKYVNFQMDLHWVTKAKADPLVYFDKYPGRFMLWHVKDMDSQGRFAPVGNGTIDFGRILNKKEQSGMQAYFVEQDETFAMEPLEAIKVSHKGLKKIGFN
jgi:sugar phosphate isomerase/epimerase